MISYESFHNVSDLNKWPKENPKFEILNIESSDDSYYWIRVWYKY